jgi:S1-C subfamily serine protease
VIYSISANAINNDTTSTFSLSPPAQPVSNTNSQVKSLYQDIKNSVVFISPRFSGIDISRNPIPSNQTSKGYGSGFVYDNYGHIVTNAHVAGALNNTVEITSSDGSSYIANVTGIDPFTDIAVLKINFTSATSLPELLPSPALKPLPIANSTTGSIGQPVMAFGYPLGPALGAPQVTLTSGIISQTHRVYISPETRTWAPALQTDAAINPGNSGGPLVNLEGQVVGINTAGLLGAQGINYAIPAEVISQVVPSLIENGTGKYNHPWLGIAAIGLDSRLAEAVGLPSNITGVMIHTIVKDGPSDVAGLKGSTRDQFGQETPGDIIVGINGHEVKTFEDLFFYLDSKVTAHDQVTLEIRNNNGVHYHVVPVRVGLKTDNEVFYCDVCI